MWTDNAPVKYTCPDIDVAVGLLDELRRNYDEYMDETHLVGIDQAIDALERVRSANDELRKWGNGLHDELAEARAKAEEWQALAEQWEEKAEGLQDEIDDLEEELKTVYQDKDNE